MGDLKLPGVGSGFPVQTFVDATVAGERAAKDQQLARRANTIEVQLSSYGSIKSVLDEFKTALKKLSENDAFQKRSTTLNNEGFIGAKADKNAVAGSYSIQVQHLAQAHKLASNAVPTDKALGSGSLTLGVGSESFTVNVDKDKSSLADVATAINNAEDNKGVRATVITDDTGSRLVYFSDKTGTNSQISVTTSSNNDGEDGNSLAALGVTNEIQAAKNAQITIDGATVTSQSNEIKGAIAGVTLDVKAINNAGGDKPTTTLTIGYDKEAVATNVKEFVNAYNKVIKTTNQLSKYDAVNEKAGPLNGDSMTRNLTSKIRELLTAPVEGAAEPIKSLTALGITTKKDGSIELDDALLKTQLADNFEKVGVLFSSENGISGKLTSLIDGFIGKEGTLTLKNESLNKQMTRVEQDADRFQDYMTSFEARVYKQFSAMDMAVARMNQQLSSVMAAFDNMPSMGTK